MVRGVHSRDDAGGAVAAVGGGGAGGGGGGGGDPYERAIGFVRLDGGAGSAERRGQLLDAFRDDPQVSG